MGMIRCPRGFGMFPFVDIHTHRQSRISSDAVLCLPSLRLVEPTLAEGLYSIGLHPWFAEDLTVEAFKSLESRVVSPNVWAIGESGLDKLCSTAFDLQQTYFQAQIELSERFGLPLVIHCVRAWGELLALRRGVRMPWLIHGFRGKPALAEQLIKAGCYLSFGQHYNVNALRLAHFSERLFLETDDASIPIQDLYISVSEVLGLSTDTLLEQLYARFIQLRHS